MSTIQAFVLGLIQGFTEFLPVSSSGHLVIVPKLFGWYGQPLVFDTTLHLGTALALLVYFYKDIILILKDLVSNLISKKLNFRFYSPNASFGIKVLLGSIPAGILGFLFGDQIETYFRSTTSVAIFLILGSLLMYLSQTYSKSFLKVPSYLSSFYIGLFQTLALLPGVSRSGATISGGLFLGLSREDAARFSFLMSIPIVFVAGMFKLSSSLDSLNQVPIAALLLGLLTSFISGITAIKFMLVFLKDHKLNLFIAYRLALAAFLLVYSLLL